MFVAAVAETKINPSSALARSVLGVSFSAALLRLQASDAAVSNYIILFKSLVLFGGI